MNKLLITLPIISLVVAGILLIQRPLDTTQDLSNITQIQWRKCWQANRNIQLECQTSQSFKSTISAFSQLADSQTKESLPQCKTFWDHWYSSEYVSPLHFKNYYSNCFLNPQLQEVAKQDSCFYNTYYLTDYIKCAGL